MGDIGFNIVQVTEKQLEEYDNIPMLVHVKSILEPTKLNKGLGGILFQEVEIEEYTKDLGSSGNAIIREFDTTNWGFFMAYKNNKPIGGAIVAGETKRIHLLDGRSDLALLWDLRVDDQFQNKGVGKALFNTVVKWAKSMHYKELKIESQNNNVRACEFYAKQDAVLSQINEYAYYQEEEFRDETQLIWYLKL